MGEGAIGRCLEDVGAREVVGDGESEPCGDDGDAGFVRIGSVSAKSTMVLKEPMSPSQAISVRVPAPAATIVRARIEYIFKRVFPA
jgi:hypothetical protein